MPAPRGDPRRDPPVAPGQLHPDPPERHRQTAGPTLCFSPGRRSGQASHTSPSCLSMRHQVETLGFFFNESQSCCQNSNRQQKDLYFRCHGFRFLIIVSVEELLGRRNPAGLRVPLWRGLSGRPGSTPGPRGPRFHSGGPSQSFTLMPCYMVSESHCSCFPFLYI